MLAAGGHIIITEAESVFTCWNLLAGAYYLAQRECGPGTLYYRAINYKSYNLKILKLLD